MNRAVRGRVMFVGEDYIIVQTEHRNKYRFSTKRDFVSGEDVWLCFSKLGLQDAFPFRLISEEELPPPDNSEETNHVYFGSLGLW